MATGGITRGYDYMKESSVNEHVLCPICSHPFIDPVVTPCDHTFCKACIKHWLDKKSECYTCRKGGISSKVLHPASRSVIQMLDKILVRCLACDEEKIPRGEFTSHLENHCVYHPQKCIASDLKCPWVGLRNQIKSHQAVCVFEMLRPALEDIMTRLQAIEKENKTLRSENHDLKEELLVLEREYNQLESTMKNNNEHSHSQHTGILIFFMFSNYQH
ncbi:unnamed protein product [Rotaria sp. Silwood1]|nr:unnamed protein product [Rotaria sp. Silwood1]CAF3717334.1 unnamed protein product [Rotaria sp. Silwood1]CAF3737257.1 unnamed protein product [Rotaria sp. Silwood1]CAF4749715.1 unnamed protein product [Rotaria sp. Silwood1]